MVTSTTACNTNLSKTLSFENSRNHRDVSFSSYLNGDEGILALNFSESGQNISSPLSNSHDHVYVGKKKVKDTEIGVFSAEKYFKGAMDDDGNPKIADKSTTKYQHEKDIQVNIDPVKPKAQPGTPSIRSVSSGNSQSVLLPRNQQHKKMSKVQTKSFLSSLGCGCSCNDKNSVVIDDHVSENSGVAQSKAITEQPKKAGVLVHTGKSLSKAWADDDTQCKKFDEMGAKLNREDCFSFPILNSKQENVTVKVKLPEGGDDATRKSLEVFGSPILENKKKSPSFERKLSMLTWDVVTPIVEETEIPRNPNVMYNDTESDASSDLFEIESFSTKSNSLLARQTSDGMSSCVTPTTCYAPSEASIAWSVVTASAADFSIMSDSEELTTAANTRNPNRIVRNAKSAPGKELNKRGPTVLLGCKSHKAVSVVGDAHKISPGPQGRCRLDPCKPMAKFQAETKLTGFGSRHGHKAFNTRSVSPAHTSHLLYIQ